MTASVTARLLQEWCTKVLTPLDFCLYQSGLVETFCAAWHALHAAGRWLGQAVSVGGQPSSLGLGGGGGAQGKGDGGGGALGGVSVLGQHQNACTLNLLANR